MARALVAALAAVVAIAGCGGRPPAGGWRPNVIIVLVDTLRADRMGFLGNDRGMTPFLDALAARSAVFERAYPSSSWTAPSVASLFTSLYPTQHGQTALGLALPDTVPTLAATLSEAGYTTAAISGHGGMAPQLGLARGFAVARLVSGPSGPLAKASGEAVTAQALAWLDGRTETERARPLFLYLHYMEPHTPYDAPAEILDRVLARRGDVARARTVTDRAADHVLDEHQHMGLPVERAARDRSQDVPLTDAELLQGVNDLYDAEVVTIDQRLAALFAGLRERGLLDDALVVFTADHGEELLEHGRLGHGMTLFEESLHVPLLIETTRHPAPARIRTVVSLLDVAPTVLAAVGVPAPAGFEGRSLWPLIDAHVGVRGWLTAARQALGAAPGGVGFSELYPLLGARQPTPSRVVIRGDRKLIVGPKGAETAFDLAADPREQAPLADDPERPALRQLLDDFAARVARGAGVGEAGRLDEATRQRLRVLGYNPD
ncbi:sulfatase [bacterium]|nr:sulfatase [bacterium]